MEVGGLLLPSALSRTLLTAAMYVLLGFAVTRWLFPRLSPGGRRVAIAFFAAHIFMFLVTAFNLPATKFDKWLWDIGREWNIPSAIAAAQIALAAFVALLTAKASSEKPAWQRLYFVGMSLVFLFMALDEYFAIHKWSPDTPYNWRGWQRTYIAAGFLIGPATLLIALRSPRRAWIWHITMLFGLSLVALAGIVFDEFPKFCAGQGLLPADLCPHLGLHDDPMENFGIWIALVALLGHLSDVLPRPSARARRSLYALPIVSIAALFLWSLAVRPEMQLNDFAIVKVIQTLETEAELRRGFRWAAVKFERDIWLNAYRVERGGDSLALQVYVSALHWRDFDDFGYSLHLIDQAAGISLAGVDASASLRHKRRLSLDDTSINFTQTIGMAIPESAPRNRALWLVLSVWRETDAGFRRQSVLESDLPLLGESQIIVDELVLQDPDSDAADAPLAKFDKVLALESVSLPGRAVAGDTLPLTMRWRSDIDDASELIQFLHLGHAESGEWFVYDQPPLGDRLPTRLWYTGLVDSETWHVPLPADLAPGTYSVFTGLYRATDQERLPMTAADGHAPSDARLPLGSLIVER